MRNDTDVNLIENILGKFGHLNLRFSLLAQGIFTF